MITYLSYMKMKNLENINGMHISIKKDVKIIC